MFTLLHISDLHRSISDPVSNAELISTLVADHDRQSTENSPIGDYDAAIVSGDIIQGAKLGASNSASEIEDQYKVAADFLSSIADRFLNGDRSKIVIAPGNHDVDWNIARSAMTEVELTPAHDVRKLLAQPDSIFRWDWNTRKLYRINDYQLYANRLGAYQRFHDSFYSAQRNPVYKDPDRNFVLHEILDRRVIVAAFSSCHRNDCFNDQGAIPEEAIAKAHLAIRDLGRPYAVKAAVWHHSVDGPPGDSAYMDISLVRRMIDRGFRVGFHGHQHQADAVSLQINLPDRTDMVVIAAGSLCAGRRELPAGVHRQYNVVEIEDSLSRCRVHVREVRSSNVFVPSARNQGNATFIEASWSPTVDMVGNRIDSSHRELRALTIGAERCAQEGRASDAVSILMPNLSKLDDYGRTLLLESAVAAKDWASALAGSEPSRSSLDLITHVEALLQLRRHVEASAALDHHADAVKLPADLRVNLSNRIAARRSLENGN